MAFPLIPFAAGLALGSLVTYGVKDEALKQRFAKIADTTAARIRAGADTLASAVARVGGGLKSRAAGAIEAAQESAEEMSDKAKAVVDEAVSKAKRRAAAAGTAVEPTDDA